jgi:hypothetical protein
MTDLSQLSNEELQALYAKAKSGAGSSGKADYGDLSTLSDEELVVQYNQAKAKERVASEAGPMQRIDDTMRSVARGIPLIGGAMDEISAGINTGAGLWGDYGQELEYQRERDRSYDEANPVASTVGQIGGAVGGGIALVPAKLFQGAGMLANTIKGAGIGAGAGAVEGFTRGEGGMEERTGEAVPAAIVGSAMGGVAPVFGKAVGAAWNGIATALANRGIEAKAVSKILGELQASGMTPQQAAQRIQELGPEAMLADTSRGMQLATGATATADTGAANMIGQRLANRREAAPQRVSRDLDQAFGPATDPYTVRQGTRQAQGAAGNEYETALRNAPRIPDAYKGNLRARFSTISEGMSQSNRQTVSAVGRELFDALDHGNPQVAARRLLDLRKTLDAQITRDPRAYDALSSADKAAQRPLREIRDIVDGTLKDNLPSFRQADAAYASPSRRQAAFDEGRTKVLRSGPNTMTPEELRAIQTRSSQQENLARQQGVRTEIDRQMSNARNNPGVTVDRVTSRDWNNQKIENMIGPQRAGQLERGLDREATFLETSNLGEASRGSRTAPLSETAQRMWGRGENSGVVGDMAAAGGAGALSSGSLTVGAATGTAVGARAMIRRMAEVLSKPAQEVVRDTADKLTATGPRREALIQALMDSAGAIPKREQTKTRIQTMAAALLAGQSGRAGYETQGAFGGRAGR